MQDTSTNDILIGRGTDQVHLLGRYANRHGLVAGATGTGKTVSLLVMAEGFSRMGVPVFMADVKGDVAGLAMAGSPGERISTRVADIGIDDYVQEPTPVVLWDLFGRDGHPVRTTVSEIGPTLLSRILDLSDSQSGVLDIVFKLVDDLGLLLLDLDDLRALLTFAAESRKLIANTYGLVTPQSVAAIQRALLRLDQEGGDLLFGEPALDLADLMRTEPGGRGVVNILAADQLVMKPKLFSTFMLWLLSELFEQLPEVGDIDKPKLVFFFDEAHLLFDDAPAPLLQRVEQVVRIIRSKGVGVYFCSQFPDDIPGDILGQLGNRIQHALRAYTPRDQKAVRVAAETFVPRPGLDVAEAISQLAVGEALTSMLMDKGIPMPVERTLICPPRCRMGAITADERGAIRAASAIGAKYDQRLNRESAYEILTARAEKIEREEEEQRLQKEAAKREREAPRAKSVRPEKESDPVADLLWGSGGRQGVVETLAKQAARAVGGQVGGRILRGLLGGILGGGRRR